MKPRCGLERVAGAIETNANIALAWETTTKKAPDELVLRTFHEKLAEKRSHSTF